MPGKKDHTFILHSNLASFEEMDARIMNALGYNLTDEHGVLMRTKYPTERYSEPEMHPVSGQMLMLINKNTTRINVDGTSEQINPLEIPGLFHANEKAASRMRLAKDWKSQGFFSKDDNV